MIPIVISSNDKILIIAPHPDDECIGVGGILAAYPEKCSVYIMTDGAQGHGSLSSNECKKIRRTEFIEEMKYLGIESYSFANIPDGTLINHLNCMEQIKLNEYSKIFVTGIKDGHSDHTAAFYSIINTINLQENHKAEVYVYEVHKELLEPTHYFDITEYLGKKERAISFHKSQLMAIPYDRLSRLNAELRALQNRQPYRYWECYEKVDPQKIIENVSETERDLSKFKQFYNLLTRWMLKGHTGRLVEVLIKKYDVIECSIYGYAELGQILEKQLSDSDILVRNVMDKKVRGKTKSGIEIINPIDGRDKNVSVIVTAIYYFDEIEAELTCMGYIHIYSLYEIISNL